MFNSAKMRLVLVSLACCIVAASIRDPSSKVLKPQYNAVIDDANSDFIKSSLLSTVTSGDLSNVKRLLALEETTLEQVAHVKSSLKRSHGTVNPECMQELDAFLDYETNFFINCGLNFQERLIPYFKGPFKKYLTQDQISTGFEKAVDSEANQTVVFIIENSAIDMVPNKVLEEALIKLCTSGSVSAVKALLARTSVDPSCQGNRALEVAFQNNFCDIVSVLLARPEVDASFNDHQLVKGDLSKVGPFTLSHLLYAPNFDPSAHDCMLATKFYANANVDSLCIVLSHPKVSLQCLDAVLKEEPVDEMVLATISLLDAVREGDLEMIKSLDFSYVYHSSMTAMYLTSLTFNKPKIFEFLEKRKPADHYKPLGVLFAARLDHVESLEAALTFRPPFRNQLRRAHYYEEFIGATLQSKAKRSLKFFFDQFKARPDHEFLELVNGLESTVTRVVNRSADLLWKYIEDNLSNEPSLKGYIMTLIGARLFSIHSTSNSLLPPELFDQIFDMSIF